MTLAGLPRLVVISDMERGAGPEWLEALEQLLREARPGGVLVLLRDRQQPIRIRLALGQRLRQLTQAYGHALAVSDRLDLALLLQADGVHLSEDSVDVLDARAFGAAHGVAWFVSAAGHDPEMLAGSRADAILLSPILAARKGRPALGRSGLERALEARSRRPTALGGCGLFALGGVTRQDAAGLLAAGADGVALIGELFVPGAVPGLLRELGLER